MTQAFRQIADIERRAMARKDSDDVSDAVLQSLHAVTQAAAHAAVLASAPDAALINELMALDESAHIHLALLWERCAYRLPDVSFEQITSGSKRLCDQLLDLYRRAIQLMQEDPLLVTAPPALLVLRAMHALRMCANWSWIRYEHPPHLLWTTAAYFYQCAERAQWGRQDCQLFTASAAMSSLEREYVCLLFIDWVGPHALSPMAIELVDALVPGCLQFAALTVEAGPAIDNVLDLASGRLTLDASKQAGKNIRYLFLGDLRERLRSQLEAIPGQGAAILSDAVEFVWRSPVIRSKRFKVRMGARTNIVQNGLIKYGFGQLVSAQRNFHFSGHMVDDDSLGYRGYKECVLREMGASGCKVFVPKRNVQPFRIGGLASICNLQGGGLALGIVRWLTRDAAGNMTIGLWLLTGAVSVFSAQPAAGAWSSGKRFEPILVVDDAKWESHGLVVLMSKMIHDEADQLVVADSGLALERIRFIEAGHDFDLSLYRLRDAP